MANSSSRWSRNTCVAGAAAEAAGAVGEVAGDAGTATAATESGGASGQGLDIVGSPSGSHHETLGGALGVTSALDRGLGGHVRVSFWCRRYCALMVPRIPASAWPGTVHTKAYVPGVSIVNVPRAVLPPCAS